MALRARVEDLINRYSLAYDSADWDEMRSVFTEDAVFRLRLPGNDPISFDGRDAILGLMTDSAKTQTDQRRHINSNLIVHDRGSEHIETTHYLTLVGTENGEITLITAGVYRLKIADDGGTLRLRELDLSLDRPY